MFDDAVIRLTLNASAVLKAFSICSSVQLSRMLIFTA